MSRVCDLTGKKAMTGNHVSFSNKKNKRKFLKKPKQKDSL